MDCHDQPRRTETALDSTGVDKCLLDISQSIFGELLDRDDVGVYCTGGHHEARTDRCSIHKHGAASAFTLFARSFCAGQPKTLAQHVEQTFTHPSVTHFTIFPIYANLIDQLFRHCWNAPGVVE